jgi:hypothetical protein
MTCMYQLRSILFARANSKLCFLLQRIPFAAENQLAPDLKSGVLLPQMSAILRNLKSNVYVKYYSKNWQRR